jgi:hypothetical protein
VQVQDVEPSAVVDLRLDAPAAGAKAETPRVIGRMHQTCAMVESLPAGEPPHPDAPVQDRAALRADPALVACTLRALGALAASEALALLLNPDRRARRITLDLASGRFASQAPETCA